MKVQCSEQNLAVIFNQKSKHFICLDYYMEMANFLAFHAGHNLLVLGALQSS